MEYPILIVGAVVDVYNLTMYKADGDTIVIPQGDPRIRDLVAKLVPALESSAGSYLLTAGDMAGANHYADAQEKTNGFVRFFKMAKSKLKEIAEKFCEPVAPVALGKTSGEPEKKPLVPVKVELPPEDQRPLTRSEAAVAEIMASAKTPAEQNFHVVNEEEEVIVAVTEDNTVIPGVQQLSVQMQAVSEGITSGEGMKRFLERTASVKRGHSVEDLLKFIQKGELPLADDGTVLVYKRLESTKEAGVFVDVHSKRVRQRVGSFVHMDESMVDPNRSRDCSNGLHVARRDYLNAFSGDVTVLAKLAPEDVIAVPEYDARKLRAKGYHIIAVLSKADAERVCRNQPMQDTELLANAVAGNHVGILEYVKITQAKGGGLIVTPTKEKAEPVADNEVRTVHSLDELEAVKPSTVDARSLALDIAAGKDQTVVAKIEDGQVTDVQVLVEEEQPRHQIQTAKRPVDILVENFEANPCVNTAKALVDFKKKSKKAWTNLGVQITVWSKALELIEKQPEPVEAPKPVPVVKAAINTASVKVPASPKVPVKAVDKPKTPAKSASAEKVKKMTQQEEMAKLVSIYEANPDKMNARAIYALKQKSKKSWEVLGVTDVKFQKKITERAKL